jgi:predicted transcriptional regulator
MNSNFNIIPNKSLVLQPPPNDMPLELRRHYIRGYFDGDGHIEDSYELSLCFNITSGSFSILDWIMKTIYMYHPELGQESYIYTIEKHNDDENNKYRIDIKNTKVLNIYKWFYEGCGEYKLDRKFDTFCFCKDKANTIMTERDEKDVLQNKLIDNLIELKNGGKTSYEVADMLNQSQGKVQYYMSKSTEIYGRNYKTLERDLKILECKNNKEKVIDIVNKFGISKSTYSVVTKRVKKYIDEIKLNDISQNT